MVQTWHDHEVESALAMKTRLTAVMNALKFAVDFENNLSAYSDDAEQMQQFLSMASDNLIPKVRKLKQGECLLVPGGWGNPNADQRQIVLFLLQREQDGGTFKFTVVNCGDGVQHHEQRPESHGCGTQRKACLSINGIPKSKLEDTSFWMCLLWPKVSKDAVGTKSIDLLYSRLLPYLAEAPLRREEDELGAAEGGGFVDHLPCDDLSGARACLEAISHLIVCHIQRDEEDGAPILPWQYVRARVMWGMVSVADADMGDGHQVEEKQRTGCAPTPSDLVLIELGCKCLAATASSAVTAGGSSDGEVRPTELELKAIGKTVSEALQQIKKWRTSLEDIAPSLPSVLPPARKLLQQSGTGTASSAGVCVGVGEVPLFGRVGLPAADLRRFVGESMVESLLLPVELTQIGLGGKGSAAGDSAGGKGAPKPPPLGNLRDAARVMRECVRLCVLLSNQNKRIANSYVLRAGLIEHLFTRLLPLPLPLDHQHKQTRCFWSSDASVAGLRYDTQKDLMHQLHLLSRHFATACLSVRPTRSFDASRTITLASILAIADTVARFIMPSSAQDTQDQPSEFSLHYSGKVGADGDGQSAGGVHFHAQPFGFSIGKRFAEESTTMLLPDPSLAAARACVLDYFRGMSVVVPASHLLLHEGMHFGSAEALLVTQLCTGLGYPTDRRRNLPLYLTDQSPLMPLFPELRALRDMCFLLKLLMVRSGDQLPPVRRWEPEQATLRWNWVPDKQSKTSGKTKKAQAQAALKRDARVEGAYEVLGFGRRLEIQALVEARDDSSQSSGMFSSMFGHVRTAVVNALGDGGENGPRVPPSDADPTVLVHGEEAPGRKRRGVKTEDDVLHLTNAELPTFVDKGEGDGATPPLPYRDTEKLLQYLCCPYMRIPLTLSFFANNTARVEALGSPQLQRLLDACLFEPGGWRSTSAPVTPVLVPPPAPVEGSSSADSRFVHDEYATPAGLLLNELAMSPTTVVRSVEVIFDLAFERDTGSADGWSASLILYALRLAVRVEGYILFLLNHARWGRDAAAAGRDQSAAAKAVGAQWESFVRGLQLPPTAGTAREQELRRAHASLRLRISGEGFHLLERWGRKAIAQKKTGIACSLHAHLILLHANHTSLLQDGEAGGMQKPLGYRAASTILSSHAYLSRHYRADAEPLVGEDEGGRRRTTMAAAAAEGFGGGGVGLGMGLGVPELELFSVLTKLRAPLLYWMQQPVNRDAASDAVEAAVRVATGEDGGRRKKPTAKVGAMELGRRTWRSMGQRHCAGRFVPTVDGRAAAQAPTPPEGAGATEAEVENYAEYLRHLTTANVQLEVNVQFGEVSVKNQKTRQLDLHLTDHPDFQYIFGTHHIGGANHSVERASADRIAIPCADVETAANRRWLLLVGRRHELQHWQTAPEYPSVPLWQQAVGQAGSMGGSLVGGLAHGIGSIGSKAGSLASSLLGDGSGAAAAGTDDGTTDTSMPSPIPPSYRAGIPHNSWVSRNLLICLRDHPNAHDFLRRATLFMPAGSVSELTAVHLVGFLKPSEAAKQAYEESQVSVIRAPIKYLVHPSLPFALSSLSFSWPDRWHGYRCGRAHPHVQRGRHHAPASGGTCVQCGGAWSPVVPLARVQFQRYLLHARLPGRLPRRRSREQGRV
jgi:hypothetical protein